MRAAGMVRLIRVPPEAGGGRRETHRARRSITDVPWIGKPARGASLIGDEDCLNQDFQDARVMRMGRVEGGGRLSVRRLGRKTRGQREGMYAERGCTGTRAGTVAADRENAGLGEGEELGDARQRSYVRWTCVCLRYRAFTRESFPACGGCRVRGEGRRVRHSRVYDGVMLPCVVCGQNRGPAVVESR